MKILITIEPIRSVRWPKLKLLVNKTVLHDGFCLPNNKKYFTLAHDLTEPLAENKITIVHYDKDGRETITDSNNDTISDRAIILKSISIDGYDVPEVVLFDKPFYINWTTRQKTEQQDHPEYIKNNLYFGYNGMYEYTFGIDGEEHYYNNLIEKERMANISNKKVIVRPDGKQVEAFEFTGKLVDSAEKESITIQELYKRVIDEN